MKLSNTRLFIVSSLICLSIGAIAAESWLRYRDSLWRQEFGEQLEQSVTRRSNNPVLLWEYRPDSRKNYSNINRHGFRGSDWSLGKADDRKRIALVGDSVVLGLDYDYDQIVASLLDTISGGATESLNFAVDGYNAFQIAELIRTRVPAFEPDLVFYIMCLNDYRIDGASGGKHLYFNPPKVLLGRLLFHLPLLLGFDYHQYFYFLNRDRVNRQILEMKKYSEAINAEFAVVVVPTFRWPDEKSPYPHNNIHKEISEWLLERQIKTVNMLEFVRPPIQRYGFDTWHLNRAGHGWVAESVYLELVKPYLDKNANPVR